MIGFSKKILAEKTLGERLRFLRKKKHLQLRDAETQTKIRCRYLEALENGHYTELPADVYVIGFIKKYADILETSSDELITIYRRERGNDNSIKVLAPEAKIKEKSPYLTRRTVALLIVFIVIAGFLGYIFYAVNNFTSAPNLEIQSPSNETVIKQDSVEVIGKTDEGDSLKINEQVVFLDERGNFKEIVKLQPGLNNIELRATNRLKKETVKVIKILAEF